MNTRKMLTGLLFAAALFITFLVQAQTDPTSGDGVLPSTKGDFWKWAIAGLSPLIVAGVKWLVPKIPKVLLPVSTPFVGIALGLILNAAGQSNLAWLDMAQAGALAVFIRETIDQAIKTFGSSDTTNSG